MSNSEKKPTGKRATKRRTAAAKPEADKAPAKAPAADTGEAVADTEAASAPSAVERAVEHAVLTERQRCGDIVETQLRHVCRTGASVGLMAVSDALSAIRTPQNDD